MNRGAPLQPQGDGPVRFRYAVIRGLALTQMYLSPSRCISLDLLEGT